MEDKNSTVIGSYSTRDEALSVIERLRNEGYDRDDIVIYTTDEAATRLGFDGLSGIDVETDENRMDGEEDRSLWERIKDTFSFDTYDSERLRQKMILYISIEEIFLLENLSSQ